MEDAEDQIVQLMNQGMNETLQWLREKGLFGLEKARPERLPFLKRASWFVLEKMKEHPWLSLLAGLILLPFFTRGSGGGSPSMMMNASGRNYMRILRNSFEQNFLIGWREKRKEAEEYKRAQDEEWRNRLHQLQLQAEEARQLRKRKKAVQRLLDMEKRQKQRVEEIRESQKKDEETINLKEQLRIEVRKELEILELKCKDMAALLRALGINVEGGPHPKTHEIRAAYKQALLTYHPDRSSKASIRQQVAAEEAFKLISRLKEKFLVTA